MTYSEEYLANPKRRRGWIPADECVQTDERGKDEMGSTGFLVVSALFLATSTAVAFGTPTELDRYVTGVLSWMSLVLAIVMLIGFFCTLRQEQERAESEPPTGDEDEAGEPESEPTETEFSLEQMRLYYEAYDRCGERSWATDQWVVERLGSLLQSSVRHRVLKDMQMLLLLQGAWPCVSAPDENSDIKFHAYDERGQFVEMTARRPAAHVIALWNIGQRLRPLS